MGGNGEGAPSDCTRGQALVMSNYMGIVCGIDMPAKAALSTSSFCLAPQGRMLHMGGAHV